MLESLLLQQGCFPVNIVKFLRAPNLKNICERLLLNFYFSSAHFCAFFIFEFHFPVHYKKNVLKFVKQLTINLVSIGTYQTIQWLERTLI